MVDNIVSIVSGLLSAGWLFPLLTHGLCIIAGGGGYRYLLKKNPAMLQKIVDSVNAVGDFGEKVVDQVKGKTNTDSTPKN